MSESESKNTPQPYRPSNILVSPALHPEHPHSLVRERLLELLFDDGYDIRTDLQHAAVSLDTIHNQAVIPSDAFILLPIPRGHELGQKEKDLRMKELFKAASLVVGLQTDDPYMHIDADDLDSPTKPIIIIDQIEREEDETWRAFHNLLEGLYAAGTVKSPPNTLVTFVDTPEEVMPVLAEHIKRPPKIQSISNSACQTRTLPLEIDEHGSYPLPQERRVAVRPKPEYNVCVFLSASTEDQYFIKAAYDLGADVARNGWGLISGAGSTSMMGSIIEGAVSEQGWTGGTTMEYIAKHEGIPPNLDQFWYNDDIYTRMKDMIEASDSFVIMPGGMGTVQELFTLLLMRHDKNPLMNKADIVICNERGFWQPLIALINAYGFHNDVHIVNKWQDVTPMLDKLRKRHDDRETIDLPVADHPHPQS